MKKIFSLALSAVVACGLIAGCGGSAKKEAAKPAKPAVPKKIVVGLDDNFPPMGFKDKDNKIVGFDIDMAKEAAKRLGMQIEFKAIDWSSKEAELKSKRIDCLWNGLDITPERQKNMLFSKPYMIAKQLIFVPKGSAIKGQADLKGKTVGVQSASSAESNVENDKALLGGLKELKKYPDCIAAMMDMETGRCDAIVTDEILGRYYMGKKPDKFVCLDAKPVGPVVDYGIAFRKEDTALMETIQKAMDEMKKDGTAKKISMKWFNADLVK